MNTGDLNYLAWIKVRREEVYKRSRNLYLKKQEDWEAEEFLKGDSCSKTLSNKNKKDISKLKINALNNGKDLVTKIDDLLQVASDFYKKLYTETEIDLEASEEILKAVKPSVTQEENTNLLQPITAGEILLAIECAPKDKSPGPDSIPSEIWSHFIQRAPMMATDFNDWLVNGLPLGLNEGIITLLHKKGDPTDVRNYRPITLLNTIYKVLTRVITNRISTILRRTISPTQSALPDRYIGHNVRLLCDLIDYVKAQKIECGILQLDQEKAFDMVSHQFLFLTMEKMGFSRSFINWVRNIYNNAHSRIKINGYLSEPIKLERGVRQGDPLSPLLFTICIEPIIRAIERDITGINVPNAIVKTSAFADDLTVLVSSHNDWVKVEKLMDLYQRASGAKFNNKKCEAILHNLDKLENSVFFQSQFTDKKHVFTNLGIPCSFNLNLEQEWNKPIKKYVATLKSWYKVNLPHS